MGAMNIFHDFFVSPLNGRNLFEGREVELARIVYPRIVEDVRRIFPQFESDSTEFDVKYETTRENLHRIVTKFREAAEARKEFVKHFPKWSHLTDDIISQLRTIAETIHLHRRNCNISRLVSASVGILGSAAVGASIACPPLLIISGPLAAAGAAVGALGGTTLFGTSMTEHVLLKKNVEKAQTVRNNCEKEFQVMSKWFVHSHDLIDSANTILGIDISLIKWSDFQNIWKAYRRGNIQDLLNKASNFVRLITGILKQQGVFSNVSPFLPTLITFFYVMILTHKQNKFIFDCVLMTQRLALSLLSGLDVSVEIGRIIATTALKGTKYGAEVLAKSTARAVTLGVFSAVGIAFDVTTIVLTSIDVHKGSFSEHGKAIEGAAQKLQNELVFLSEVYEELKND